MKSKKKQITRKKFRVKRKLRLWVILSFIFICLIGFLFYSYKVVLWKKNVEENERVKKKTEENIKIVKNDKNDKKPKIDVDFEELKKQNPDTVAYIKLFNTNIDYIVVKGKDNSYYLNHNFEKKYNIAGWIFADYRNKVDESDKNLIIYGHNTRDNSMFGTLKNILDKDWYENRDNHIVTLVTEKKKYYYIVFSTYTIIPEDYYISTSFKNNADFDKFVKKLKSRSNYNYGIDVTGDDKILTLSSCITEGKKRVVLHAKLIDI